jgi:cytochrome bd-type quinol oxidase subunit 2
MRILLGSLVAFVVGLVLFYTAAVGTGFWYIYAYNVRNTDGGMAMAIMFGIGPVAGLIGGTISAIIAGVRLSRRERQRAEAGLPATQWPFWLSLAVALLVGLIVYFAVWAVVDTVGPRSYATYEAALFVSLLPLVLGLATAGLLGWRALQRTTR